jgi:hypothetical protein
LCFINEEEPCPVDTGWAKCQIFQNQAGMAAGGGLFLAGENLVDPGISPHLKAQFMASAFKTAIGGVCLVVPLLWLPSHVATPIITGVSILMLVSGAYTAWRTSVADRRLRLWARVVIWSAVVITLGAFAATAILGPGAFAPSWEDLTGANEAGR